MSDFQVTVIGGGPGGYVAAIRAAQLGLKVAIIEKRKTLGGTCLNVGCIPSKALLASSEHFHFAHERFAEHGIKTSKIELDLPAMMKRKEKVVSTLTGRLDFLMKKNKITRYVGLGSLKDAKTVEIDNEDKKETITSDTIILATGSSVIDLPFLKPDGDKVVTSDHAIAFDKVPKSLLVIGAGAVGLELGSVWKRLGADVTVVEFLPRIALGFDLEVSNVLQKSLEKQGLKFSLDTKVQSAEVSKSGVKLVATKDGKEVKFEGEKVLVAVGRKPFIEGTGLDKVGVKLTERGRIQVNTNFQTSVSNIFAIGDVIDGPMLAHKAEEEGVAVAELISGQKVHVNYNVIPGAVYTSPEAASVGATEDTLKEKGVEYNVGKFNFGANGRALGNDTTEGFVKVLADKKTDRVLGVHILGHNASELIAEAVTLMEFGGSAEDLGRTVHAHPTMSEALKEASLAVGKRAVSG